MTIGERIKELRLEKELTQKQLAQILQCGQSRVCDWEKNLCEPSASAIIKIAKFFNVSTEYLLGLSDEWGNPLNDKEKTPDTIVSDDKKQLLKLYDTLSPERKREAIVWLKTLNEIDSKTDTKKNNRLG